MHHPIARFPSTPLFGLLLQLRMVDWLITLSKSDGVAQNLGAA